MFAAWTLVSHAAITWILVGLIWTMQVVHYPLFGAVKSDFRAYHQSHMRRITFLVAPLMLVELAGAVYFSLHPPLGTTSPQWLVALALLGVVWVVTGLFSAPQHRRMEATGFDAVHQRRLMTQNLVRSLAWTVRGVLVAWLVVRWATTLQTSLGAP